VKGIKSTACSRQAVPRPLTGLAITTSGARSSLRGRVRLPPSSRRHKGRTIFVQLTDTIDPTPGPSDQKFVPNCCPGIGIGGCMNSLDQPAAVSIASGRNICCDLFWAELWLREAMGARKEGENEPALERLVVSPRPRAKFFT
jgi:hypothetical protein